MRPVSFETFHVFLASPSDMEEERQEVRRFFDLWNRTSAQVFETRLEVVDWENYSMAGVGRPQELITRQTLQRFSGSLILFIGLLGNRFGSPTGKSESGTEEEFEWAMKRRRGTEGPEIKLFFRRQEKIELDADPDTLIAAADQLRKVRAFEAKYRSRQRIYYKEFTPGEFREVLRLDLELWLADAERPWRQAKKPVRVASTARPKGYGPMPAGKPFRERVTDLHMLWVRGGRFQIGQGKYENAAWVRVSPYWIGETPITNRQYGIFLSHSRHREPEFQNDPRFSDSEQPVVGVTWDDAMAFCKWLSKASGLRCSLCTEAQWEFAARGEDGRRYPWGNEAPTPRLAWYGADRAEGRPMPAGIYPYGRGPFGTLDQAGNVWEWCRDAFYKDAYDSWAAGEPLDPVTDLREEDRDAADNVLRVLRGACWSDRPDLLASAVRYFRRASYRSIRVGFRIAIQPVAAS